MAAERVRQWVSRVTRTKTVSEDLYETSLSKCLNTFDIMLLGIGHMIGAGVYVLTGTVIHDKAGPSTILSFLIAGFAALLSALCYAEFGARVPKAGSAYSYTYVTIGEIWGFVIGWNIVLEHLIGAASVARAWSGSIDAMVDGAIRNGTITYIGSLGKGSPWISDYPDFIAMGITLLMFLVVAVGAKISSVFNSTFTILNGIVILFIFGAGMYFADIKNWTNKAHGGFFPFGFGGTVSGAASCFFAYIGFEGIAVASEEAKNAERSVPIATVMAMLIVTVLYMLAASSITLMVPYYEVDISAPFPMAFAERGVMWAKYVVAVGTLLGITCSILGSAYSLPRSVYAMAEDGLLFKFLAYIHPRTQTPVYSIAVFGTLAAIMALIFEIETLVEFMSIGTLFAYTIVAASIIILRYLPVGRCQFKLKPEGAPEPEPEGMSERSTIVKKSKSHDDFGRLRQSMSSLPVLRHFEPGNGVISATILMMLCMTAFCMTAVLGAGYLHQAAWWAILLLIVFGIGIVIFYLIIVAHEQNDAFLTFQIPFVPLLPATCVFVNLYLMFSLNYLTWIRLAIWMAIGLVLYFGYGVRHSRENRSGEGYGPMVEFKGDTALSQSTLTNFDEEIREQQPPRKEEGFY